MIDLQEGRRQMKERCIAIALKYTPDTITYIKPRAALSGRAFAATTTLGVMIAAPRPFTRKSLYIFLHELAHVVCKHVTTEKRRKHRYQEELEAEQWAHKVMRSEGLSVPRLMTQQARQYVFRKMRHAQKRGAKMRVTKADVRFGDSYEMPSLR